MSLAYAEFPLDVRENLAVQFFVDAIRDEETQLSTRLVDFTDLKSALAYSMEFDLRKLLRRSLYMQGSTQHRKRTSDGKDVLSRRLCFEGCEPSSNAEKKFKMETDISVEALTMTTEDRWSLSEIRKAQLEDPDIRPILKMKQNSADRPSWQEIARESPATKRYWALWNSLYLKDGVLYRKWESNDRGFYR
ncbi:hypothetical protein AVEN_224912-1 [Araneus ventricosus]|uniref:Uncharacterized protein n=1 Tax=Araneus ventricosus TaxID=182803 RepID=A0A4Y1ZJX4_ARAVE|nr:hypothetical protein AVEN_224912-1 [Araneus ventricosus]